MSDTAEPQVPVTPTVDQNGGNPVTPPENGGNGTTPTLDEVYKTFKTKEEFDNHSAGILNSAKAKAEKELLAMLGLKPDEKDKLQKFKESYEASLTESEKMQRDIETLSNKVSILEEKLVEKDAIISAISKSTGKTAEDVSKYVKMAKGLVSETVSIEDAIDEVLKIANLKQENMPKGNPPPNTTETHADENPFKTGNLTEQGKLIRTDREKARELYFSVYHKAPSW